MRVEVSRFNSSIFELLHSNKKDRAFLRREDVEFIDALQAEAAHASRAKKLPPFVARLLPAPSIEIADERWRTLRARISGSFPAVKILP